MISLSTSLPYTCALFDLDGTLTDSAPGIIDCLQQALRESNWAKPSVEDMYKYLGPPLHFSLKEFAGMDDAQIKKTTAIFRAHYIERGEKNNAVYPGIHSLLYALQAANIPMAVATGKPETSAVAILQHFNLDHFFVAICGTDPANHRLTKTDVIKEALHNLNEQQLDTDRPIMIGDRIYDIEGAASHNIPTIMVEWGYGSFEESHNAHTIVHSPEQLKKILIPQNVLA